MVDRGSEQSGRAGGERVERRRGRRRVWWAVVVVAIAVMLGLGVGTCVYRMNWIWTVKDSTGTTMTYFTIEKGSLELFQLKMGWVTSDVPVRERRYNGAWYAGFQPQVGFKRLPGAYLDIKFPFAAAMLGGAAAVVVLAIVLGRRWRAQAGRCACGYALTGLGASGTCPECGVRWGAASSAPSGQ